MGLSTLSLGALVAFLVLLVVVVVAVVVLVVVVVAFGCRWLANLLFCRRTFLPLPLLVIALFPFGRLSSPTFPPHLSTGRWQGPEADLGATGFLWATFYAISATELSTSLPHILTSRNGRPPPAPPFAAPLIVARLLLVIFPLKIHRVSETTACRSLK